MVSKESLKTTILEFFKLTHVLWSLALNVKLLVGVLAHICEHNGLRQHILFHLGAVGNAVNRHLQGKREKKNIVTTCLCVILPLTSGSATTSMTSALISQWALFSITTQNGVLKCPVSSRCKYSHLGTFRHWLGLRGNRASTFRSEDRWWGYGTARTRCHSHMCCDHYTGMLEDKSWLFRKNSRVWIFFNNSYFVVLMSEMTLSVLYELKNQKLKSIPILYAKDPLNKMIL